MRWVIGEHVRADLLGYSGLDISGVQSIVQLYPSGSRTGTIDGSKLKSIVIGAHYGVRVILCASTDEERWQEAPWRCIRMVEGNTYFTSDETPAVRVPDLECLDGFERRKAQQDPQESYPFATTLAEGKGWTFGRIGPLKDHVRMIRVEHEDRPIPPPPKGEPEAKPKTKD